MSIYYTSYHTSYHTSKISTANDKFSVFENKSFLWNNSLIRILLLFFGIAFISTQVQAQNSMTGDGFGGRLWYVPHNYQVGAYTAYTVCGANSQLYGWGGNVWGELGNTTGTSSVNPVAIPGMTNVRFYTTGYISVVIKNDNTASVWGRGEVTQSSGSGFTGLPVQNIISNVKFADGGLNHALFVKYDGTVWGVGQNFNGELGTGTTSNTPTTTPVKMLGITTAVRAVALGYRAPWAVANSVILLANGTLMLTGDNVAASPTSTPVPLAGLTNVVDIKATTGTPFALTSSGDVYSIYLGVATKLTLPAGAGSIIAMSANADGGVLLLLDDKGQVYAQGDNNWGQLGIGNTVNQGTPVLSATNAVDIYAGETFSYILNADNSLSVTGNLANGRGVTYSNTYLGQGSFSSSWVKINPQLATISGTSTKLCAAAPMTGCLAGGIAPAVTPATATASCPSTVNLKTLAQTQAVPTGATLIWSTHNLPTLASDTLTTVQATAVSTSGKYYAFFYDKVNNCYSPADSVTVTITPCCNAGATAPVLSATTKSNVCPATTVDLTSGLVTSTCPAGSSLEWHTSATVTAANKYTTPAAATAGTYYPVCFDATNTCYSPAPAIGVTVTITVCCAAGTVPPTLIKN